MVDRMSRMALGGALLLAGLIAGQVRGEAAEKGPAEDRRGTFPDWTYRMRVFGQLIPFQKLAGEELAQFVGDLKSNGVNVVFVAGSSFAIARKQLTGISDLKRFVDACHKQGIKVVLHCMGLSRHKGTDAGELTADDQKRVLKDAEGREVRHGHYWWYCPNSPHRDEFLTEQGVYYQLITKTGVDGYFDDWCFLASTACACEACREKFTAETGNTLPKDPRSPIWNNFEDPTWRSFAVWRDRTMADFMVALRERVRKTTPEFVITAYTTSSTLAKGYASGCDYAGWAAGGAILGLEQCYVDSFYGWPYWIPDQKYMFGLASFHGAPQGWAVVYTEGAREAGQKSVFAWAKTRSQGLALWLCAERAGNLDIKDGIKQGFPFEARHEDLYARPQPFGNIGILFSAQTRQTYRAYDPKDLERYVRDWKGWCHVLSEANLAYNVLPDAQVEAGIPDGYRLLILVNAACLSKIQVEKIRRFVQRGGNLIATHETSLYDETGKRLDNFALSDVLGVDFNRLPSGKPRDDSRLQIRGNTKGSRIVQGLPRLLTHNARQAIVRSHPGATTIAEAQISGTSSPGIVLGRYGMGRVLYIAGKPGYFSEFPMMPDFTRLRNVESLTWQDTRVPEYGRLILNAVDFCLDRTPSLKAVNIPKGVMINGFRIQGNRLAIHLLNAIGGELKPEMKFDRESIQDVVFPEVRSSKPGESMTILVNERIEKGYLVSPDFEGRVEATVEETGNGYWSVQVPSLRRYSVLVLEGPIAQ